MTFQLPEPECNRTGTGNKFNLVMRSTVSKKRQVFRTANKLSINFYIEDNKMKCLLSDITLNVIQCITK